MTNVPAGDYLFSQELLRMCDPFLQLNYTRAFDPPLPLLRRESREKAGREESGLVERYSAKSGRVLEQYAQVEGKRQGRCLLFFPSGQVASERWYKDDIVWGRAIDYFQNGTIQSRFGYKNGRLHGPFSTWHESGNPLVEGFYDEGMPDGTFAVKNGEGLVRRSTHFTKGKRDGSDAGFSDDGYLLFLDTWVMGERKKSPFKDYIEQYLLRS